MNSEILNRIQYMSEELAIRKERERLLKWEIDSSGYISEYAARKILNYATPAGLSQESPETVEEEPEEPEEVIPPDPPKNPIVKVRVKGEPAQKKSRIDRESVIALKKAGMPAAAIAKEMGCSAATIYAIWKEDRN